MLGQCGRSLLVISNVWLLWGMIGSKSAIEPSVVDKPLHFINTKVQESCIITCIDQFGIRKSHQDTTRSNCILGKYFVKFLTVKVSCIIFPGHLHNVEISFET